MINASERIIGSFPNAAPGRASENAYHLVHLKTALKLRNRLLQAFGMKGDKKDEMLTGNWAVRFCNSLRLNNFNKAWPLSLTALRIANFKFMSFS